MTYSLDNSPRARAICQVCSENNCSFEYNGTIQPCPFAKRGQKECQVGQFGFYDLMDLFDIIVMDGYYKKGKHLK